MDDWLCNLARGGEQKYRVEFPLMIISSSILVHRSIVKRFRPYKTAHVWSYRYKFIQFIPVSMSHRLKHRLRTIDAGSYCRQLINFILAMSTISTQSIWSVNLMRLIFFHLAIALTFCHYSRHDFIVYVT